MVESAKTLEKAARWLVSLALAATFPFSGNPAQAQQAPPVQGGR
jgi:hypothetical protein